MSVVLVLNNDIYIFISRSVIVVVQQAATSYLDIEMGLCDASCPASYQLKSFKNTSYMCTVLYECSFELYRSVASMPPCKPSVKWLTVEVLTMMGPFLSHLTADDVDSSPKEKVKDSAQFNWE